MKPSESSLKIAREIIDIHFDPPVPEAVADMMGSEWVSLREKGRPVFDEEPFSGLIAAIATALSQQEKKIEILVKMMKELLSSSVPIHGDCVKDLKTGDVIICQCGTSSAWSNARAALKEAGVEE